MPRAKFVSFLFARELRVFYTSRAVMTRAWLLSCGRGG